MEEMENENGTLKRELDEARSLVMRQQNRIFKLEEQLESVQRVDPMWVGSRWLDNVLRLIAFGVQGVLCILRECLPQIIYIYIFLFLSFSFFFFLSFFHTVL